MTRKQQKGGTKEMASRKTDKPSGPPGKCHRSTIWAKLTAIDDLAESNPGAISRDDAELWLLFFGYMLARLHRTKNPLAKWVAYYMARKLGEPAPEHVLTYLDRVAEEIVVGLVDRPPATNADADAALAAALGLAKKVKGRGHPLNECWHFKRDFGIWVDCRRQIQTLTETHGNGVERAAFQNVAYRYGLSMSQVRRVYAEHKKMFPRVS
jgi:hypothetical protein